MRRLPAVLGLLVLIAACSAPPQKEIDLAQGALDAARAAGAEQYAPQQYADAMSSLQQAHDAVAQNDYRLALTRALDAHDRAQDAAKGAADGKAHARGQAEAATAGAAAALAQFLARIDAAAAAGVTARELATARPAAADAQAAVQKARAAIAAEDYPAATEAVKGIPERITAEIAALEAIAARRTAKPPRRPR
jgi:hypothetical protein